MKAAYYAERSGDEETFIYGEMPDPKIGPRQVLIRIKATAINRKDLFRREGASGGGSPPFPFVDGLEVAGLIESVGPEVTDRRVGQRVVATLPYGGYAELAAVNRAGTVPLPESLSFEEGASIPIVFLTSWFALVKMLRIEAGETVLVQSGGSGVGMAGIQIAKNLKTRVNSTACAYKTVARACALGADLAINYQTHDFLPEVMRYTDGRGVDVVLESVGGDVLTKSIQALAPLGRLITVGNSSRSSVAPDLNLVRRKNAIYTGFNLGGQMSYGGVISELAKIMELCGQGKMRTVVDKVFPLEEASEAHRYVEERRNFGKVVLRP